MYELMIEGDFAAAHRLRGYDGRCEKLHGHNWKVELVVAGDTTDRLGLLVDFRDLKAILNEALESFDHKYLNELDAFRECNPTTENLARIIYRMVSTRLPEGVRARSVTTWESPRCGARYSE
jgi:6-pyruvoyltetrahydropterin/6-carboxytetrahydropterin synthase